MELLEPRRPLDPATDVVVASVPMLGRSDSQTLKLLDPSQFKAIIVDEAHHAVAGSYLRILQHFGADHNRAEVAVWGCSATVFRHDGRALEGVFDMVTFELSLLDLVAQGHLCRPRAVLVRTDIDLTDITPGGGSDFSLEELSARLNITHRTDAVVAAWLETAKGRRATLVFGVDVAHVQALTAAFRAAGVDAREVVGTTPDAERANTVEDFRAGRVPVLVNCGVLTEGTDLPIVDCVLLARPTRSAGLYQQMVGRGLRLHPGKDDCLLIDIVDVVGRLGVVSAPTLVGLAHDFDISGAPLSSPCLTSLRLPHALLLPSVLPPPSRLTTGEDLFETRIKMDQLVAVPPCIVADTQEHPTAGAGKSLHDAVELLAVRAFSERCLSESSPSVIV